MGGKIMKKAKFVKTAIIRVELEYPFLPKYSDEQIKAMMQLIELPENYKEDSYKFIKIIND